jgi:hypothetical protein
MLIMKILGSRTAGRTLLTQGSLVVTRPMHAADGRDTAVVLAILFRQSNEQHPLELIPFVY